MRKKFALCYLLVFFLVFTQCKSALCGNTFPGTGNPAAWSDALPYYNLANKYLNSERFQQAVEKYQEAISRYPYDPDFYINLGVTYRKLEQYPDAERAFKRALELDPKDWMSWSNLGNAYLKQDRLKDTLSAFQKALQCNPPAAEKPKIQQDIADISKFIKMQEASKQQAAAAANAANKAQGANARQAPKAGGAAQPLNAADQARLNADKKSSGWDY